MVTKYLFFPTVAHFIFSYLIESHDVWPSHLEALLLCIVLLTARYRELRLFCVSGQSLVTLLSSFWIKWSDQIRSLNNWILWYMAIWLSHLANWVVGQSGVVRCHITVGGEGLWTSWKLERVFLRLLSFHLRVRAFNLTEIIGSHLCLVVSRMIRMNRLRLSLTKSGQLCLIHGHLPGHVLVSVWRLVLPDQRS